MSRFAGRGLDKAWFAFCVVSPVQLTKYRKSQLISFFAATYRQSSVLTQYLPSITAILTLAVANNPLHRLSIAVSDLMAGQHAVPGLGSVVYQVHP